MTVMQIGDIVALDFPLKRRTIQAALKELRDAGLAEGAGKHRSTRAQSVESEAESVS